MSTILPHDFVMDVPDMSMQIRPAITGNITRSVWTVVSEQQYSILKDFEILKLDAKVVVCSSEICIYELFESLLSVVCEYDSICIRLF